MAQSYVETWEVKMGFIKLVFALICLVATTVSGKDVISDLQSKIDLLSSEVASLKEENLKIHQRERNSDISNYLAFDCFRNSDLALYGIIPFDDCEGTKFSTAVIKYSIELLFNNSKFKDLATSLPNLACHNGAEQNLI